MAQFFRVNPARRAWRRIKAAVGGAIALGCGLATGEASAAETLRTAAAVYGVASWGVNDPHPIELEGVVTLVDPARRLLVLQDDTGAVGLNFDVAAAALSTGRRIRLSATESWPRIESMPEYPFEPTTRERLTSLENPSWNLAYVTRLRGFVHPPKTGSYSFAVASDDTSEVWLSPNEDPRAAQRIAAVTTFTQAREWNQSPGQKSDPVWLEAGRKYYIEVLHEQRGGADHLSVAWEGPDSTRQIIGGSHLSPWPDATPATAADSRPAGHILAEHWRYRAIEGVGLLTRPRQLTSSLVISPPTVVDLGPASPPPPLWTTPGRPLRQADAYRWAELDGVVEFISSGSNPLVLEVGAGRSRTRVVLLGGLDIPVQRLLGRSVRLRGVAERALSPVEEPILGTLWVPSRDVVLRTLAWPDPERFPLTSIAELLESRRPRDLPVRIRGRVLATDGNQLTLSDSGAFYGYASDDGEHWTRVGPPVEIAMPETVEAGLVVSSRSSVSPATATFDHVQGLPADLPVSGLGTPERAATLKRHGERFTFVGSGHDVWVPPDQAHFAHAPLSGAGEIVARLVHFSSNEAWAKAGLMIRESTAPDAQFVDLVQTGTGNCYLQWRQTAEGSAPRSVVHETPKRAIWVKLARRYNAVTVETSSAHDAKTGTVVEVLGYLANESEGARITDALCRNLPSGTQPETGNELRPLVAIADLNSGRPNRSGYDQLKLRGVVTFAGVVRGQQYIAVQDASGAIFIRGESIPLTPNLEAGQLLEVHSNPGWQTTDIGIIGNVGIVLGPATLPMPIQHPAENALPRRGAASWIEVEGVVRAVSADGLVELRAAGGLFDVAVKDAPADAFVPHIDAHLRLRGAISYPSENRRLLLVPSLQQVQVVENPRTAPFDLPAQTVVDLTSTSRVEPRLNRVKIEGVVTFVAPDHLYVEDATGGARVEVSHPSTLKVGDAVQAAGFADLVDTRSLVLSHAVVRQGSSTLVIKPQRAGASELLSGQSDSRLVQVRALASRTRHSDLMHTYELQIENRILRASLPRTGTAPPDVPTGSVLDLTGVCVFETDLPQWMKVSASPSSFLPSRLILRSVADITVVHKPRWWAIKRTLIVTSITAGVLVIALGWIHVLRRRVAQRTRELNQAMEELKRETQTAATLAERNRLAGEIHDSLEQGFSGVILQLDTTAKLTSCPPEVRSGLSLARQMVAFSRNEVRHAVWDLQSPVLEGADLRAAIERIVTQIAPESLSVRIQVSGAVRQLSSTIEHHLLRIAQESITNTVKHANARHLDVTLLYSNEDVGLRLSDDGRGFEPGTIMQDAARHFGLRSLRGRAAKIRGHIKIISAPGSGTTVEVTVPLEPQRS